MSGEATMKMVILTILLGLVVPITPLTIKRMQGARPKTAN
jgi:hypothetical protein